MADERDSLRGRRLLQPLAQWSADDVLELVEERIPEGQRLEYKRELNLGREKERLEVAKDHSGMANASGGLIVYGLDEGEGPDAYSVPIAATPLSDGGARARLGDVLDSSVSPPLNLDIESVPAPEGGFFLLVRVFPRAGPLHMVEGYGDKRHYLRVDIKTRPMNQHEVERAYAELRGAQDRAAGLLAALPLMPRLNRPRSVDELRLRAEGKSPRWLPWISVVTLPLDAPNPLLVMRRPTRRDFPERQGGRVGTSRSARAPFASTLYADESLLADDASLLQHRLRLYRSGVFEWGRRFRHEEGNAIPSRSLAMGAYNTLAYFADVYAEVGYHGRLAVYVRIDNAENALLSVSRQVTDSPAEQPAGVEFVNARIDTNVDALIANPWPAVHEAMDLMWQAWGYERCLLFSPAGQYLTD